MSLREDAIELESQIQANQAKHGKRLLHMSRETKDLLEARFKCKDLAEMFQCEIVVNKKIQRIWTPSVVR